ncbi:hypothetical protein Pelo_9751 [Pelomyxa schiedti]|nr:hypothetical protein Pelo_9751 [Pelomyxa schiedti]
MFGSAIEAEKAVRNVVNITLWKIMIIPHSQEVLAHAPQQYILYPQAMNSRHSSISSDVPAVPISSPGEFRVPGLRYLIPDEMRKGIAQVCDFGFALFFENWDTIDTDFHFEAIHKIDLFQKHHISDFSMMLLEEGNQQSGDDLDPADIT